MGRETKILLAFLGLLSGTFVGVLSTKLLVPRPPAGAGPDVHTGFGVDQPHDLVEPPSLSVRPAPPPVAAGRLPPDAPKTRAATEPEPAAEVPGNRLPRDPFVTQTGLQSPALPPADQPPDDLLPPAGMPPADGKNPPAEISPTVQESRSPPWEQASADPLLPPASPPTMPPLTPGMSHGPGSGYVAVAGDSWWSLAERAYGDGRLYRALFAWNRRLDPRVSLVPGTRLELPERQQLEASWPRLVPGR